MSLTIRIGKVGDDPRALTKHFSTSGTVERTVDIHEPFNIIRPVFVLGHVAANEYEKCNYIQVVEWDRYYFIKKIAELSGQRIEIECLEDVLMTYKDNIKDMRCIITRQSFGNALHYLKDNEVTINQNTITITKEFNFNRVGWNDFDTFMITTIG